MTRKRFIPELSAINALREYPHNLVSVYDLVAFKVIKASATTTDMSEMGIGIAQTICASNGKAMHLFSKGDVLACLEKRHPQKSESDSADFIADGLVAIQAAIDEVRKCVGLLNEQAEIQHKASRHIFKELGKLRELLDPPRPIETLVDEAA